MQREDTCLFTGLCLSDLMWVLMSFLFVFRHLAVTEDLHADLLKSQNALRLWQEYERLTGECCVLLNQHWERLGELMSSSDREENTVELLNSRMQSISVSNF